MRVPGGNTVPLAGRPLPDEEGIPSQPALPRNRHRQQTLFQYCVPSVGRTHERGLTKTASDFEITPTNSFPWGDQLTIGDQVDSAGLFRVLSHNVNGLSKADNHEDVRLFATAMHEKTVSVFGIQETNRNFERPSMLQSFHHHLRRSSKAHKGAVSSAKLHFPADYQPGGTAVSVRNQWATRLLSQGSDDLGRWSWITLAGRGTTQITFLSGYRVCDGSPQSQLTSRTVRAQQEWMYADRGVSNVNLRTQFISDLIRLVNELQDKGQDIVLMLDANEPSGHASGVDRLLTECGLIDAHTKLHEITPPPPTHQRGSAKIDFMLISPRLVPALRAAAILALHDGYLSDHRALVVEFDAHTMFQGETSPVLAPCARPLTSTNPRAVHVYIDEMKKLTAKYQLVELIDALSCRSALGLWSDDDVRQWEVLDSLLERCRRAAEKKCTPIRSGQLPWSPELETAGKRMRYWRMRGREFTSRNTNSEELEQLADAVDISPEDRIWKTSKEVHNLCRAAKRAHTAVKKDAVALRHLHLIAAAKLAATLHHTSEAAAVSAIAAREKSSRQFRQLRSILKVGQSSGFDRLDIPDVYAVLREGEEVPRIPLVVKEEIEAVLLPHTELRFRQHRETPFGHGERKMKLGIDCTSDDAKALREGSYDRDLELLSEEAREWLRQLRTKDFVTQNDGPISVTISTDDWITGWAKMRESTASAPGAGHYGHYKTASVAARLPKEHPDHMPTLAQMYAAMCSLPLLHGFSPKRWRTCVDAIIEKIPGKPRIEKLRIIMLYEADFNFILKYVWGKRLVRHAEDHNCLGVANHGSRAGRQTTDALMEKLLVYEIARLTRTSVVTVDNDAKSCYDRIIKTLSSIACMGVGLPLSAAVMHNLTHHGMVHSIKSSHGLFKPYSGSDSDELEGTGQGSGASPAIWLIYSVSMLEAFKRFTTGIAIPSPYEDIVLQLLAIFYVDDGMPGVNDALQVEAATLGTLLQQAEECSQSWERLLFVSGGALELSKCFAYIVYWDLSGGEHRLLDPSEIPNCEPQEDHYLGPISLTYGSVSPERHRLVTESPWKGRRTLGVRIAPAGNWDDEARYRRQQSRELALLIAGSTMSTDTARMGYRSMVCPKLEYPLAVTQFSQKQCDRISSPALRACLSQMGYNCNMPREVVYGPLELGGLGMHDYFIEQGIAQIATLVGHTRQDSETAKMIAIELQWCQVQAGTAFHLLESPDIAIEYVETCWVMCVRSFLSTYKLRMHFTTIVQPGIQCAGDEFIMDALRSRGSCTVSELQQLNACRLFLRVSRLSDIAVSDGSRFTANSLSGNNEDTNFVSIDGWPRQGRPPRKWWILWRRKLRCVFSADGATSKFRVGLGAWNHSLRVAEWNTLVSTSSVLGEVYVRRDDGLFDVWRQPRSGDRSGRMSVRPSMRGTVDLPPTDALPACLGKRLKNGSRRVYYRPRVSEEAARVELPSPQSFSDYIHLQPPHVQRLLQQCDVSDDTVRALVDLLYEGKDVDGATDGGLADSVGTFGFVCGDACSMTILSKGCGQVEGGSTFMSSTRTELAGMLALATYLRLAVNWCHVVLPQKNCHCKVYCDSQAALSRIKDIAYDGFGTTWRCRENYDLEAAIRGCLSSTEMLFQWEWIRGHAIKRKKRHLFSRAETLNDEADIMATHARSFPSSLVDDHWPEQAVSLVSPSGRMGGRLPHELRYCCTAPDIMSYWQDRYKWSASQLSKVDLVSTKSALARVRGAAARRLQKLRCGWLPVNNRESRIDPDRLMGCSACSTVNLIPETVDHLFQCNSPIRKKAVRDRMATLHFDFRKWKTSSLLIKALSIGALAWVEGNETPSVLSLDLPDTVMGQRIARAYVDQTSLGWNALFRGFWATEWRHAQDYQFTLYTSRERQDTGERWSRKAQTWFIDLFELIWGMRNDQEHGAEPEMQRLIRLAKCERAIRRLYHKGDDLPYCERTPFRDSIDFLLQRSVPDQELWISQTERFLRKAFRRVRKRARDNQMAITAFFDLLPQGF